MKRLELLGVYEWGLLGIVFLVILHAPFSVGIGSVLPDYATVLKAWKEVGLALLSILAVVLIIRHKLWTDLLRNWLVRLSLAFIGLHLLLAALIGGDGESIAAGLMIDLRFIVMFLLTYVLVVLRPQALRRILLAVAAGAAIVLGFGLLQITVLPDGILREIGYSSRTITPYTTIDSNPEYVRINSTLRGPNPLGALTVLYASLALAYALRHKGNWLRSKPHILATAGVAASIAVLFASYSRSAYIAMVAALLIMFLSMRKLSKRIIFVAGAATFALLLSLALVSTTDWYSNVILHEDPESTVQTKSNEGHLESLADGSYRAVTQPIGAGVGSTGSASLYDDLPANDTIIENYYFFVAHESGWIGLGLFISLFGLLLYRLWLLRNNWIALGVFASGVGLALIGILLPVWADETVALIWWAIAGAVMGTSGIIGGRHGRTTSKQTTTRTS